MIETFLRQTANANTRATYKRGLARFADWVNRQGIDLTALEARHVSEYVTQLQQDLSGASVNAYLSAVRAFLRWAELNGYLPKGSYQAAQVVENVKVAVRLPKALNEDQLDDVMCAPDLSTEAGERDVAFMSLLAATGLRLTEALNLDVEDLDFKRRTVVVFGKGSIERRVFFSQLAAENLLHYLAGRSRGPLFANRWGERISARYMQKRLQQYGIHPHALRHTFATELYKRTGDIRYVQEFLGHSRSETTEIYVKAVGPREDLYRTTMDTAPILHLPPRGGIQHDRRKEPTTWTARKEIQN